MVNRVVKYSLLMFPIASAGLGVWQLQRLEWKTNLLANLQKQIQEEPIDLLSISTASQLASLEYRRLRARGKFDPNPRNQLYLKPRQLVVNEEAILRGRNAHQSNIGVHVITPFLVDGTNLRILVNRGWLPASGKENVHETATIGIEEPEQPIEIVGVVRASDSKPRYGMKNDLSRNEWQIRDVEAMARALKTAPIFLDLEQDTSRTKGPFGGQTQLSVRNEHLNYAITWFSLSVLSYLMWYTKYGKRQLFSGRPKQPRPI